MKKLITLFLLFSLMRLNILAQCAYTGLLTVHVTRYDGFADQTVVGFNPCSTDTFSGTYDANKNFGALNRPTLYTINSGQFMAINILNSVATVPSVPMGLEPGGTGDFVMAFTVADFDSSTTICLQDLQLSNFMYNVRTGSGYTFFADSTENPNRFVIHFNSGTCTSTGIENTGDDDNISVYPNPLSPIAIGGGWQLTVGNEYMNAQMEILDVNGSIVYKSVITKPHSEIPAPLAGGIYFLRIVSGNPARAGVVRKLVKL